MEFMSIRYFRGGILLAAACCAGAWAQQYNISTVAGTGGAPGFVMGLAQFNVLIHGGAPVGPAVPLEVTVGGVTAPAGVAIAVQ